MTLGKQEALLRVAKASPETVLVASSYRLKTVLRLSQVGSVLVLKVSCSRLGLVLEASYQVLDLSHGGLDVTQPGVLELSCFRLETVPEPLPPGARSVQVPSQGGSVTVQQASQKRPGADSYPSRFCPFPDLNQSEKRPVSTPNEPLKAAVSVSEMANLCRLSRSRFHALVRDGVFPKPVQKVPGKRPYYTADLSRQCLEIRQTGIGLNGEIVLFNRPGKTRPSRKPVTKAPSPEHADLVEALRSLGLAATPEPVGKAVQTLFPGGTEGVAEGEVIRQVFLYLRKEQ